MTSVHTHDDPVIPDVTPTSQKRLRGLLAWEQQRFQRVAAGLGLPDGTICTLHCPTRSVTVELPLPRDDGSITVLAGFRLQHSNALGPAKGGTPRPPRTRKPHGWKDALNQFEIFFPGRLDVH